MGEPGMKPCCLCGLAEDDQLKYGQVFRVDGLTVHHFCMLFSPNLAQNGKDDEGAEGFLAVDIRKEIARSNGTSCCYCSKPGATGLCMSMKCKKHYHPSCAVGANGLLQFFGQFKSFCEEHRPRQNVMGRELAESCSICLERTDPQDDHHVLWTPCCRHFFHRACLQRMAYHFGYFFYCPGCRNKDNISGFLKHMRHFGIFIPKRDASWELVPNAFGELLERHLVCDVRYCLCSQGRSHQENDADSPWRLCVCSTCGSAGTHVACSDLPETVTDWVCPSCTLEPPPAGAAPKSSLREFIAKRAPPGAVQPQAPAPTTQPAGEGSSSGPAPPPAPPLNVLFSLREILSELEEPERLVKFTVNPLSGLSVQTRPVSGARLAAREPGRRPVAFCAEELLPEAVVSVDEQAQAELRLWSENHVVTCDDDLPEWCFYSTEKRRAAFVGQGRRDAPASVGGTSAAPAPEAAAVDPISTPVESSSAAPATAGDDTFVAADHASGPVTAAVDPAPTPTAVRGARTGLRGRPRRMVAVARSSPTKLRRRSSMASVEQQPVSSDSSDCDDPSTASEAEPGEDNSLTEIRPVEFRPGVRTATVAGAASGKRTLSADGAASQPPPNKMRRADTKQPTAVTAAGASSGKADDTDDDVMIIEDKPTPQTPATAAAAGPSDAAATTGAATTSATSSDETKATTTAASDASRMNQMREVYRARAALHGFPCPVCDKKHETLTQATLHYHRHGVGQPLFRCKICDAKFTCWQPAHVREKHPHVRSEDILSSIENNFEQGKKNLARLMLQKKKLYSEELLDMVIKVTLNLNMVRVAKPAPGPRLAQPTTSVLARLASARDKEKQDKKAEDEKRQKLSQLKSLRIAKVTKPKDDPEWKPGMPDTKVVRLVGQSSVKTGASPLKAGETAAAAAPSGDVKPSAPASTADSGDGMAACDQCNFRGIAAAVKRHGYWHTDEAQERGRALRYHCHRCHYASDVSSHLQVHLVCAHVIERPSWDNSGSRSAEPSSTGRQPTSGGRQQSASLPAEQKRCLQQRRYDCPFCDSFFSERADFAVHLTRQHVDPARRRRHQCPQRHCYGGGATESELSHHVRWYHKSAPLRNRLCTDCGGTVYHGKDEQHGARVCVREQAQTYECPMPICGFGTDRQGEIDRHLIECHSLWVRGAAGRRAAPYFCPECPAEVDHSEFLKHIATHRTLTVGGANGAGKETAAKKEGESEKRGAGTTAGDRDKGKGRPASVGYRKPGPGRPRKYPDPSRLPSEPPAAIQKDAAPANKTEAPSQGTSATDVVGSEAKSDSGTNAARRSARRRPDGAPTPPLPSTEVTAKPPTAATNTAKQFPAAAGPSPAAAATGPSPAPAAVPTRSSLASVKLSLQGPAPDAAVPAKPTPPSAKPSPASAKPSPASAKPSPASAKPSPASAKPSPASAKPSPASGKPSPASAKPSPASAKPSPAAEAPARPSPAAQASAKPSPASAKPSPAPVTTAVTTKDPTALSDGDVMFADDDDWLADDPAEVDLPGAAVTVAEDSAGRETDSAPVPVPAAAATARRGRHGRGGWRGRGGVRRGGRGGRTGKSTPSDSGATSQPPERPASAEEPPRRVTRRDSVERHGSVEPAGAGQNSVSAGQSGARVEQARQSNSGQSGKGQSGTGQKGTGQKGTEQSGTKQSVGSSGAARKDTTAWDRMSVGRFLRVRCAQTVREAALHEPHESRADRSATRGEPEHCFFCEYRAESAGGLTEHLSAEHAQKVRAFERFLRSCKARADGKRCPICGVIFRAKWAFFRHIMSHPVNVPAIAAVQI